MQLRVPINNGLIVIKIEGGRVMARGQVRQSKYAETRIMNLGEKPTDAWNDKF